MVRVSSLNRLSDRADMIIVPASTFQIATFVGAS
jgi:hypothetical protein